MTTQAEQTAYSRRPGLDITLHVVRVIVGLLFIFSGLVKANDPNGLANKMAEILEVFAQDFTNAHMPWWHDQMISLSHHALGFSVVLISSEIILGVALLLGFVWRVAAWLMLAINIFFTFLTAYIYYWDVIKHNPKVRECGCFGDCIKISNSETFWKDVILLLMALLLFIFRKRIHPLLPKYPNTSVFILAVFFVFGIQWWTLEHLPFHDCMPYAVGKDICEGMKPPKECVTDSFTYVFTFKHNGSLEKVRQDEYDKVDSTWGDPVSTETILVRKGNGLCEPGVKDFSVNDYSGNSFTDAMLHDAGYKFLLFIRDPAHARTDNLDRLRALSAQASAKGIPIYILSSGIRADNDAWQHMAALTSSEIYTLDQTASKTAMRTDPGLMLLQGCIIKGKWSFRDYPASLTAAGVK